MKAKTRQCLYCNNTFTVTHGNQYHCPDKECQYQKKLAEQPLVWKIGENVKKVYQANYFIISNLMGANKKAEFESRQLEKMGFDQFAFYGMKTDGKNTYYIVEEYCFRLENSKIYIWKM
jgi:hypothetical protein